ncbi:MAG: hypothetical protein Q9183_007462, partial [Haloplaca sp. 2 TL-2023]
MTSANDPSSFTLPKVPVPHEKFIPYINGKHGNDIPDAVAPYNDFEAKLREGFAQYRHHQALEDPNINAVPVFKGGQDT